MAVDIKDDTVAVVPGTIVVFNTSCLRQPALPGPERYRCKAWGRSRDATELPSCVRFRALIGFVWPARNGTASDTAAAGSDGSGSVLEPVPKLKFL